jgi:hypothetical protein
MEAVSDQQSAISKGTSCRRGNGKELGDWDTGQPWASAQRITKTRHWESTNRNPHSSDPRVGFVFSAFRVFVIHGVLLSSQEAVSHQFRIQS